MVGVAALILRGRRVSHPGVTVETLWATICATTTQVRVRVRLKERPGDQDPQRR